MTQMQTIERRLQAIEQDLEDLKRRVPPHQNEKCWVEKIAGTFKDDPDFEKIVKLGRKFRESVNAGVK